ncbi:MAG: hypothetical protein PHT99_03300 [Methanoregula sp.]|nr:hypothetical protein [Methanoregula sp.]
MKSALTLLVVILAVLACGCTAAAPSGTVSSLAATPAATGTPVATAAVSIPDLTGTWTGTMQGYDEDLGFTDYPNLTMKLTVDQQHNRLFSGHLVFSGNGTGSTVDMAGVISRDGTTFTMVEKGSGYTTGTVLGKDEIELTHLYDGEPYSVAVDTLKRV